MRARTRRGEPVVTGAAPPDAATRVGWRRVALFYGIAFGGAWVVAGALVGLRGLVPAIPQAVLLGGVALFYMTLPAVAGLVVERTAGRGHLLGREWARIKASPGRVLGRIAWVSVAAWALAIACLFGVAAASSALAIPGAGELVLTQEAMRANLERLLPPGTDPAALGTLPPVGVLVAATLAQALAVGFTINGLFALGEEYGWRGVLADELEPLGAARATLLIGVLWGLWHAPVIILLGHNYGAEWAWGVPVMVVWTVPLAFLLRWARNRSGSVFAPAVVHGAYNGAAGLFVYLIAGGSVLVSVPVGVLAGVALAAAAAVAWAAGRRRPAMG